MVSRYAQLSVEERKRIECWRAAKVSPDEMAGVLGRHRGTIFRELQRNHFVDRSMPKVVGYFAMAAQLQTADWRARHRKLVRHGRLRETVEKRLRTGWMPEQIAGRMRLEGARPRVCQETISSTSTRGTGCGPNCGGICRTTGWRNGPGGLGSARPHGSAAGSASCFAPRRSHTARSSGTGRAIWSCSRGASDRQTSPR